MSEQIWVDRTTTWHAIGKSVEQCRDLESVLAESGLDYTVSKRPVYAEIAPHQMLQVHNRFATTRDTDNHVYDIVSDKYAVVQNRDAFDFVSYMGDELSFEKAGETENGMIYIIGKLPQVDILGDAFTPHVIFRNGFGGKTKITAAICPLRLVCQNQFNFAFHNAQNAITIRHVGNAEAKLEDAREVLKLTADYMSEINAMAQKYAGAHLQPRELDMVLNQLFPMENIEQMNSFKRHQLEVARENFTTAYNAEDNRNFRGTAWGLINAYTDYITHKVPMGKSETKEEGKFMAVTFHPGMMNAILNALQNIGVVA